MWGAMKVSNWTAETAKIQGERVVGLKMAQEGEEGILGFKQINVNF